MTILVCAAITAAALGLAANGLGINSNTIELFPEKLPVRKTHSAFIELFPVLGGVLA